METMSIFKINPWAEYWYSAETAAVMLQEYAREGYMDAREGDPLDAVEEEDLRRKMRKIVSNFRYAERVVFSCVCGDYDREVYESPYDAAADAAEITPERARIIHKHLIKELRKYLSPI